MAEYNLGTARGAIEIDYKGNGAFKKAQGDLDTTAKKADNSNKAFGKVGTALAGAGAIVAGGLGLAVKSAMSFEKRLSAIQAVSGNTAGEMEQIRTKALQLGKDTAFSASEAASAMEELAKAGISTKDILNGAADATVALAAAGEVSLPEAATIASNAMNQFGLAAKDMPNIADKIAGAANASAIDVKEFGYSLSQAGAVAHLAGLSFDDLSVAIAEMGNAGIKGSDAGTSLKTFLNNLIPTTDKQVSKFQELGLSTLNVQKTMEVLRAHGVKPVGTDTVALTGQLQKLAAKLSNSKEGSAKAKKAFLDLASSTGAMQNQFFNADGSLKSLREIQDVLAKSTSGLTKEQKLATLQLLFGSDAIRAAAVMADNGAAGYDKLSTSIGKVKAADVAKTRMDNLSGSIEQLKGSAETFAIQLGTRIIPVVRKVVDSATDLLNKFLGLSPATQDLIVKVAAGAAAFLLLGGGLIKTVQYADGLVKSIKTIVGLFSFNPAIISLGLLAGAILLAYQNSESFRNTVNGIATAIGTNLGPILGTLGSTILPIINKGLGLLKSALSGTSGTIAGFTAAALGIGIAVSRGLGGIGRSVGTALQSISLLTGGLRGVETTSGRVGAAVGRFGSTMSRIGGFLGGPWGIAIEAAAVGVGLLVNKFQEGKRHVDTFTQAIIADNGALGQNVAQTLAKRLADDGTLQHLKELGIDMDLYTQALLGNKDATAQVQNQLNGMITAQTNAMAGARYHTQAENERMAALKEVNSQLSNVTGELGKAKDAAALQMAAENALSTQDDLTAGSQQKLGAQIDYTSAAFQGQRKSVSDLNDMFGTFSGSALSVQQQEIQFRGSVDQLTESFKNNGRTMDLNTQAGRDNKQALISAIQASQQLAMDKAQETGKWADAKATIEANKESLYRVAEAAGYSKGEAKKLVDQLYRIPKEIDTQIRLQYQATLSIVVRGAYNKLQANPKLVGFATGGLIGGFGGPTADDKLAAVSSGEFIVNADSTSKWLPLLAAINSGKLTKSAVPHSTTMVAAAGSGGDNSLVAELRALRAEVAASASRTGAAFGSALRGGAQSSALAARTATGRI